MAEYCLSEADSHLGARLNLKVNSINHTTSSDDSLQPTTGQIVGVKDTLLDFARLHTSHGAVDSDHWEFDEACASDARSSLLPDDSISVGGVDQEANKPVPGGRPFRDGLVDLLSLANAYDDEVSINVPGLKRLRDVDGIPHYYAALQVDEKLEGCKTPTTSDSSEDSSTSWCTSAFSSEDPYNLGDTASSCADDSQNSESDSSKAEQDGQHIVNEDGRYPSAVENPGALDFCVIEDPASNPLFSEEFRNSLFKVGESPLAGFGAFAVRDLKSGEVVLAEKALLRADASSLYNKLEKLSSEQMQAFLRLHPRYYTPSQELRHAIFRTNSFCTPGGSSMYLIASRFNHACRTRNNLEYEYDRSKKCLVFVANKDIPAGTELTIRYSEYPTTLYDHWGFRCACGGCLPLTDAECEDIDQAAGRYGEW